MKKILLALCTLLIMLGGFKAYDYYKIIKVSNVDLGSKKDVYFYIPSGSNFDSVSNKLVSEKIILDVESFKWVADKKKYTKNIKPGKYLLRNGMNNNDLVNLLRSGKQIPVKVTFNQISTVKQLSGIVGQQIEADSTEIINLLSDHQFISKYGFNHNTITALFIPNTYEFYWNTSGEEFVQRMAKEFKKFWTAERLKKAKKIGLSQSEVATLAAIVEAETKKRDEMPKVAGLYLNRLKKGIKLQADPTVKFATGDPTKKRIYKKDLKIESPYNTYLHKGLPPGPIACPSITALKAVLNYTPHKYIYMCAKPDYSGYHNFASNYAQHLVNRAKYIRFLRKEGIR